MKIGICLLLALLINSAHTKAHDLNNNSTAPILILARNNNFGLYTGEILRAEGFNEFQINSITDAKINLAYLKKFDIVILTENKLAATHQSMITRYV